MAPPTSVTVVYVGHSVQVVVTQDVKSASASHHDSLVGRMVIVTIGLSILVYQQEAVTVLTCSESILTTMKDFVCFLRRHTTAQKMGGAIFEALPQPYCTMNQIYGSSLIKGMMTAT